MLHVGATYYYAGRADISRLERDAYREDYADTLRQFAHRPYELMARWRLWQRRNPSQDAGVDTVPK